MGVIVKPLVTEKASALNEHGKYGFVVSKKANKVQIKKEVEKTYGVTVESVNTMVHPGRSKSRYTKSGIIEGRTPSYKKAIIKVADGDIIDFYSGI
ncbi:MAG: 50S ribosomal protein L23 [Flammeovirgaceae bacterium]|nr:50S ribosomal protein L23 [Flammeovirgaceae bacterium]MBE63704.1 50S ribosomal protein L23 [Flammeovirgaceae bacterium]MBS42348.1 50S ribosomal protein L23 [Nocardioides sp.]|tara:strand:- start:12 stop:299 length:288 start_codon:yes stop_codon:yes gene_type:complete